MPRIADALQRESQTVDLEQGGFERLLARRERKQRNRQIRAGVVGVIVALATAAFLVRAIHVDTTPANPPKPIGAGEVLYGGTARNPNTGAVRSVVHSAALPVGARSITASAWSYDHEWVAFRASSGGSTGGSIWIADAVSGAPRRIGADGRWTPWVWSPTADQLAFVRGRRLILIDAATGRETDLGSPAIRKDEVQAMVWSPDGTRITYSGGPRRGTVYSIDVRTGEYSVLVPQPAGAGWITDIDWSPDGEHVALTYQPGSLYVANADGSGIRLVDGRVPADQWADWEPDGSSAWSPDGTRLAYSSFTTPDHSESQVWTVSADLSSRSLVTTGCCIGGPVWSLDGSQLAMLIEVPTSDVNHYLVMNADGTGGRTDTSELIYRSWRGGAYFCFCYG